MSKIILMSRVIIAMGVLDFIALFLFCIITYDVILMDYFFFPLGIHDYYLPFLVQGFDGAFHPFPKGLESIVASLIVRPRISSCFLLFHFLVNWVMCVVSEKSIMWSVLQALMVPVIKGLAHLQ